VVNLKFGCGVAIVNVCGNKVLACYLINCVFNMKIGEKSLNWYLIVDD
jgi:hypothetical protein